MAYLTLSNNSFVSKSIKEKIDFYLKQNYFPLKEDTKTIHYKNLNDTSNQIITSIKKYNKYLLKQINFIYLDDISDWNVLCFSDPKNPLILLNIRQISQDYKHYSSAFDGIKEAIAYATIFGFLGIYFGANLCINCFGKMQHSGQYTTDMYYRYEELAQYLFDNYKDDFMFFITSTDFKINKIYMFGKKYVFSLAIMLGEDKMKLSKIGELLDLSEEEAYAFLDIYKGVAHATYLNYKAGKGL